MIVKDKLYLTHLDLSSADNKEDNGEKNNNDKASHDRNYNVGQIYTCRL